MFDLEHLNSQALMKLFVSVSAAAAVVVVFHVEILKFEVSKISLRIIIDKRDFN
jgi:hypothetical protein